MRAMSFVSFRVLLRTISMRQPLSTSEQAVPKEVGGKATLNVILAREYGQPSTCLERRLLIVTRNRDLKLMILVLLQENMKSGFIKTLPEIHI